MTARPAAPRRAQTAGLLRALVSLQGRLRRRGFWLTFLALVVLFATVQYLALGFAAFSRPFSSRAQGAALIAPTAAVLEALIAWPVVATFVRRGHDRGYGAARTVAVLAVMLGLRLLSGVLPAGVRMPLQVVVLAYLLVDYGAIRGGVGPNRFGADPRATGGAL